VHPESINVRNDSKSFLAMCEELLERGHQVRIHARGESMKPNILDGDIVEVTPLANRLVGKGDIVLARTPDGLKLHRISKSLESGVVTRGDAGQENDLPATKLLGTVVVIERQGIRRLASGPIAKISHYCRYMAHRLRIAALRRLRERRAFLGLLLVLVAGFAAIPQTASAQADLAVTSNTAAPSPVSPNGQITFTVVVINNGPNSANTPSVTFATPANTTFVSAAKTAGAGTWNCTNPPVGGTGTSTCTRTTNMGNGSTSTFTFVVLVGSTVAGNTVITGTANISSTTTDNTPANNSLSANVTVNAADLGLTQTASPAVVQPGGTITYVLTLTNNGANAAAGAVAYQQTPPNTTFQSVVVNPAANWTCSTPAVGATGQILCSDSANLASGASVTFTIVVNVNGGTAAGTVILNSADTTATTADPVSSNNASTSSVLVENGAQADLATSIVASPTPVFVASNLTYTIKVQNLGLVAAAASQLVDTIPAGTTFVSSSTSQGSCSGTSTVTCTFGSVASGTTITVTISVTTPLTAGTLTNTATASSSTADPISTNNSATVLTVVQPLVCASPGRDGAGGTLTGIVNAYYPPASAGTLAAGSTSVTLSAAAAGGAQTPIAAGDLLLVIQMQDAAINSTNTSSYGHGTPGEPASGWTNLNNTGNFEFVTATNAVAVGGGSLTFKGTGPTGGLLNTYTSAAYSAGVQGQRTYQIIRVPQYTSATLSSTLTAMIWNGATGGVLAVDVSSQLTLGGTVAVDGLGFRGGAGRILTGGAGASTDYVTLATNNANGSKGEGIAGTPRYVAPAISAITAATTATDTGVEGLPNGSYARGAPGNGGAGATDANPAANDQNSGGGAGGNGGAGGQGGFGWNSAGIVGGFGGSAFPGTSSAMVMGGGGGAGTTNNGSWWDNPSGTGNSNCGANCTGIYSSGAAGGGIVIVHTGSVTGTGTITANGTSSLDVENDGGGGGGAGGSIRFLASSGPLTGLTVQANGGNGGDTWPSQAPGTFPGNRHGAGGGGAGGALFLSGAPTASSVLGGSPGITTTALDPYGATVGAAGTLNTTYTIPQTPGTQPGSYCASADLSVTNSGTPAVVVPGNNITYTQGVTNNGPSAAVNAVFSEAVPANTTFQSLVVPSGWTCTTPAVGATGNINCTNPLVANGASSTFTLAVQVNAGTTNQTQITDTASITSGTLDPTLSNNTASVTTIVGLATTADLTVTNSGSPNPVIAGNNITYTQVVSNQGPATATSVSFSEAIPANTTFVSMATNGWSCSLPAVGGTGTITCTIASLAAGASVTFQPVVKVTAGTASGTVISDTAAVSSSTPDPNPNSNDAKANVVVATATQADLSVTASASPNPVLAGNNITFTETVTNSGPAAPVTDTFTTSVPANTTFVSLGVPAGWVCTPPAVGTAGPVSISCTAVTMAANTSASFPLVVKVNQATAPGTTISIAPTVSSVTGDPTSANNNASASTVVASPSQADVSIIKTASPEPVDQSTNLVYTLQVRNNGPATAQGVTVSDPLPAQVSYSSVFTTQGSCSQSAGTVSCNLGSINPGGLVIITINVTANTFSSATTASNTATVSATTGDPNSTNNSSTVISTIQSPTAVQLVYFRAIPRSNGVLLEWKTRDEVRNLGFNVYREDATGQHRLNPSLIAGSALVLRHGHPQHAAKTYQWLDSQEASPSSSYWLEDVDLNGTKNQHGPAQLEAPVASSEAPTAAAMITQMNSTLRESATKSAGAGATRPQFAPPGRIVEPTVQPATLDHLPAVKISVQSEGWYRIMRSDLVKAGLDPFANAQNLRLFAEGIEQPFLILGNQFGPLGANDAIEFYGTGIDTPYSGTRVYWLVPSDRPGLRITQQHGSFSGGSEPSSFPATVVRQDRTTYFAALLNSEDQDNFFGALVTSDPVEQQITIVNKAETSDSAILEITLQGVTDAQSHDVSVLLNQNSIGTISFSNQQNKTATFSVSPSALLDGPNVVTLTALDGDNDVSLVQTIALHYAHSFTADSNWLRMEAPAGSRVHVTGFSNPQIRVFDISSRTAFEQLNGAVQFSSGSYSVDFSVPGAPSQGSHVLVAFTPDQLSAPSALRFHAPGSLRTRRDGAGIVVVTHPDFSASIAPLVRLRESEGNSVNVVTIDEIFDSFNYGERSPYAVQNFLKWASSAWRIRPQAVLLVGDSSLDPRDYLGFGSFDFVPTRLIQTAALKTASDDWFTDFDGTGFASVPVGRLPARTSADADLMVSKIVGYEQSTGSWNGQALVVADQNVGADFSTTANSVASLLNRRTNVTKIFGAQADPATVKQQILDAINQGQVLVNYAGHGSVEQWSFADLLNNSDVAALNNHERLPVFLIMDCLNGFFQDVYTQSLAESLLLAPNGGAVAVWASSGFTDAPPQAAMDQALIQTLAAYPNLPLGKAIMLAKKQTADRDVRRTWILFGDPSMQVHFSEIPKLIVPVKPVVKNGPLPIKKPN